MLGILPNQLRSLLRISTPNFGQAFDDIALTLFCHGYQIWKLRKTMMFRYWKQIAREDWKPHPVYRKKKKNAIIQEQEKCRSPFHYLNRFQHIPTPCPCSHNIV